MRIGQAVDIHAEGSCLVIRQLHSPAYDVGTLVSGITDDNQHALEESGPRVGNEAW